MPAPSPRLVWIDHVRLAVIMLVVNMHACVTYSHVGSWYLMSAREPSLAEKVPFIIWQSLLQSFFMGLLFFFGGYFAERSVTRRGVARFLKERLFRLGLPALFYMLVIHPLIVRGMNPWGALFAPPLEYYRRFIVTGRWLSASGPLWFAIALLLFCLGLAIVRSLVRAPHAGRKPPPGGSTLLLFAFTLGLASFAVRLVQPIGTDFFNLQLCFFAQYIAAFVVGVRAADGGWLEALVEMRTVRMAGWIALFAGPCVLLLLLLTGVPSGTDAFMGGWHWQALGLAVWEQLAGTGLALGLMAWFSRSWNENTAPLRWLSDRSFGVYVLHPPILIGLAMALRRLPDQPYAMALLLTVLGLAGSYAAADIALRIPGLRSILN